MDPITLLLALATGVAFGFALGYRHRLRRLQAKYRIALQYIPVASWTAFSQELEDAASPKDPQ